MKDQVDGVVGDGVVRLTDTEARAIDRLFAIRSRIVRYYPGLTDAAVMAAAIAVLAVGMGDDG